MRSAQLAGASKGRHDFTVLHTEQNSAVLQRAEAMGNDERGTAPDQPLSCLHDRSFRFEINRTCRLVQNQDRSVFQECPRESDALPFASREGRTAFADDSLITIGKSHDKIVSVGCLRSFDDVVLSSVGGRVGDVVGDSPRKQYWVLRNQAELAPQIRQFVFANINTIKENLPVSGVIKTREQTH